MVYKNFTVRMKKELSNKLKDFDIDNWGFTKNTPEYIVLVNKDTGKKLNIVKEDFNINF